jgi:hypothetical protein
MLDAACLCASRSIVKLYQVNIAVVIALILGAMLGAAVAIAWPGGARPDWEGHASSTSSFSSGIEVRFVNFRDDARGVWVEIEVLGRPELGDRTSASSPPQLTNRQGQTALAREGSRVGDNGRRMEYGFDGVPGRVGGGDLTLVIQGLEFDEPSSAVNGEPQPALVEGAWAVRFTVPLVCPGGQVVQTEGRPTCELPPP